jgi:double zinc ribbon protein
MLGEALAAALVGVIAIWLVLQPLARRSSAPSRPVEPLDPEETPKGIALTALKEIEFDRETGKLSDADYDFLKAKYTAAALEALRLESVTDEPAGGSDDVEAMIAAKVRALRSASASPPSDDRSAFTTTSRACPTCGPRPEADAVFCSTCGHRLPTGSACDRCGAALLPDSRFCEACGRQVAA